MSNVLVWILCGLIIKMLGGLATLGNEKYFTIFALVGTAAAIIDFFRAWTWLVGERR